MKAFVSICLPVRNGAAFLEAALESILCQTFPDFEILAPDDCSDDSSFAILEKYAQLDPRVKTWRNQRQLGLFANYNQCILNGLGSYIKPMAQDDIIEPRMLEVCLARFAEQPQLALVSTGRKILDEDIKEYFPPTDIATPITLLKEHASYSRQEIWRTCLMPLRNIIGEPCTVMFRSDTNCMFSEQLFHVGDLELWLRLMRHGDYSYIPDELATYRRHKNNATTQNMRQLRVVNDIIHCGDTLSSIMAECGISKEDFLKTNLKSFASQIQVQVNEGIFREAEDNSQEMELSQAEMKALKRGLIHTLMLLAKNDESQTNAQEDCKKIELNESKLRLLLQSFPWRITRPLRECKRAFVTLRNKRIKETSFSFSFKNPIEYLDYLRAERKRIVESRSWKVGKFLLAILKSARLKRSLQ